MANGVWVPCYNSIREHRKTYALSAILGVPVYAAVGIVMSLSVWACDMAEDGDLSRHPPEAIARAVGWEKDANDLIGALVRSGFVDRDGNRLLIHDYEEYSGRVIEERRKTRERKRAYRSMKKGTNAGQAPAQSRDKDGTNVGQSPGQGWDIGGTNAGQSRATERETETATETERSGADAPHDPTDLKRGAADAHKGGAFIPPTLCEIEAYCKERSSNVDAKRFFDFYEANDWVDARGNPVLNWRQKLITWEKTERVGIQSDKGGNKHGRQNDYGGIIGF